MRRILWITLCMVMGFSMAPTIYAQATDVNAHQVHLSVAQMGLTTGLTLRSSQLQTGMHFTLANNVVVNKATLFLHLKIQSKLSDSQTDLAVMLNGQKVGTIPLDLSPTKQRNYQLAVPAILMASANNLSIHLDNGKVQQCFSDDANHYQITILPSSYLELSELPLESTPSLAQLPQPFLQTSQMTPQALSMVLPSSPTPDQVSAGALLASWFGIKASYHDIHWQVFKDQLPKGNAIVFGYPGQTVAGIKLPQTKSAAVKIIANPIDDKSQLLLIAGEGNELRQAAWWLTQTKLPVQSYDNQISPQTIPYRNSYDAPKWISTQHRIYFRQLIQNQKDLAVAGIWHNAIQVHFRAAPDLFLWDGETIPLHIGYQFPAQQWIDSKKSYLSLNFNHHFLQNFPINKPGTLEHLWGKLGYDERQDHADIALAPYMIYGDNLLSLYFQITPKADAPCDVNVSRNIQSQVSNNSWIDLSHAHHFSMLPNLSFFIGASFPFSIKADFAQTALLLPPAPSTAQIATLLNLAARAGNNTGVVLAHNQVLFGLPHNKESSDVLKNRHVLVVSSMSAETFNQHLFTNTPFTINNNTLSVRAPSLWQHLRALVTGHWALQGEAANHYLMSNRAWRGFISYRSPWNSKRVVVMATASNDKQLSLLHNDLENSQTNADIRKDVSIITSDNGVQSFQVSPHFASGQLPWYLKIIWLASTHMVFIALCTIFACLVIAWAVISLMKRRSEKRLNMESHQ